MERVVWPTGKRAIPMPVGRGAGPCDATRCTAPTSASTFPPVPSDTLQARVERALPQLQNTRLNQDVLSAGVVNDLAVDDRPQVSFTVVLTKAEPPAFARDVRKAPRAGPGRARR